MWASTSADGRMKAPAGGVDMMGSGREAIRMDALALADSGAKTAAIKAPSPSEDVRNHMRR